MRILQVNCVYGKGSTGKITKDIHLSLLEHGIESFACYGRGADVDGQGAVRVASENMSKLRKVISMADGMPYRFTRWTNKKLEDFINTEKPDIVHLQCLNGYFLDIYRIINFLKQRKIPTILTLHAEFMYTGGCGYALDCNQWIDGCKRCPDRKVRLGVVGLDRVKQNYELMYQAFRGFNSLTVVGVSEWISNRAKQSQILHDCKVITIHNGIETKGIFHPRDVRNVSKKYKFDEDKIKVLSVVPNLESELKGGKLMMRLAKTMDSEKYQFIVVGAREAVENKPDNLIVIPYTESQNELAEIYSSADVFVLGSKMDNYPTVCIEANSCGTPVVGFDVGGVSETIYQEMGEVVPYGDIDGMKRKIEEWATRKKLISEDIKKDATLRNSKERMAEDYIDLYESLIRTC